MAAVGTEQEASHLRRALELAEGGRGRVSPNPLVGAVIVRDGERDRRGIPRRARGSARRARGDRGLPGPRRRPGRLDHLRDARALRPHRPPAALHRGDPRGRASPASSTPPRTRPRRPPAAGPGCCATAASRSSLPPVPRRPRRACSTSPSASAPAPAARWSPTRRRCRSTAASPRRPATPAGSRASRAASWSTAGAPSATPSRSGSAPRSPMTRCSPPGSRAHARQPTRVVFDSRRPAATRPRRWSTSIDRGAADRGLRPRGCLGAARRAGARRGGGDRRHRAQRPRRGWRPRSTSSDGARSRTCWSRAARPSPARSSTPARSTQVRLFIAPVFVGAGRGARRPRGRRVPCGSPTGSGPLATELRADRRGHAGPREAAGVVRRLMFTGISRSSGRVEAVEASRRRRAPADSRRARRRARRRRLGRGQRRLPDRDLRRRRLSSTPTSCTRRSR